MAVGAVVCGGPKRGFAAALVAFLVIGPTSSAALALPRGAEVEVYAADLEFPVDMAWVPGSRTLFFTENNTGKIRVMRGRNLLRRPCVRLDVAHDSEQGALGIVLHPRFKANKWLYVMYTNASPEEARVTRFTVRKNRCRSPKTIMSGVPAWTDRNHYGGQLEFVGEKLFVSTGDNGNPATAQNTSNRLGKILRYNDDGTVPSDNPFSLDWRWLLLPGGDRVFGSPNPVWSYGHRNPFGLARRPGTDQLFQTENGPGCDDEVNLIKRGRNYGWGRGYAPPYCGTAGLGSDPTAPLKRWTPPIAPTDAWWYRGRMKVLSDSLYMGAFAGSLHRFDLNERGTQIRSHRVIHRDDPIIDVSRGPGGWLYFLTPKAIKRIVPKESAGAPD